MRQFRNFAALDLVFPPAGVALIGENGAGKTNLLEAIYYLEIFRSFRGAPDTQLVRFDADAFYVRGRFGSPDGADREVSAGYAPRTQRKRIIVDGSEPDRIGAAIGHVGVVIFSPSDVAIVTGAPGERRRFLDIVLSLQSPAYLAALQRYRSALRQRNAQLKRGGDAALLAAWNAGLIEAGACVTAARAQWVADHAGTYARHYRQISGGACGALRFRPSLPLEEEHAAEPAYGEQIFEAELRRTASRERERGMTLVGAHRDDLGMTLAPGGGEIELRDYGSGGQQRTAAIALRLVEAATLRDRRGSDPIVLLDDVFAELDAARSRRLLELLEAEQRGQFILTAPKESDVRLRKVELVRWRIQAGQVTS